MTIHLDIRYALRGLLRSRLATTALLLSLALGAGANAAVFGLVDALLVRAPAGVIAPARLVTLHTSQFSGATFGPSSHPDYVSVKASATAFESLAAIDDGSLATVRVRDRLEPVRIAAVSEEFFDLLGLGPSLGTLLGPGGGPEDVPGAIISHALWGVLGRDEAIVGAALAIGERHYTITGVGPERFRGLRLDAPCDVWIRLDALADGLPFRIESWREAWSRLRPSSTRWPPRWRRNTPTRTAARSRCPRNLDESRDSGTRAWSRAGGTRWRC